MTTFLSITPSRLERQLVDADYSTGVLLNTGSPAAYTIAPITALLAISFTPTATAGTFGLDDSAVPVTNLTPRTRKGVGSGFDTGLPFYVRAFARRKPGSTGAIAAQTVILKNQAATVELGRFQVLAANANEEPVSGWIDLFMPAGDTRWTLAEAESLSFAITAVDPDLEIVVEIYGQE